MSPFLLVNSHGLSEVEVHCLLSLKMLVSLSVQGPLCYSCEHKILMSSAGCLQMVDNHTLQTPIRYTSGRCPKSFRGFHNLKNLLKTSENTENLNIWKLMSLF